MHIQDAVHGYIVLNELEEEVIDTPEMQRLRRIKQLGFSQIVYPSATHTRFEHSLGACYLAGKFADALKLDEQDAQTLRLAALFHDLGHGPFSHTADFIYEKYGLRHEHFSKQKISDSRIGDIVRDHGIDPADIIALISGDGPLGSIIAGHIDVDRMDYLMRDAHYTGVAYGTIDADTIIRSAELLDDRVAFHGKYLTAIESLLMARYLMIPTVYTHRTSRIATRMFRQAFKFLEAEGALDVKQLPYMDEPEILMAMRNSETAADLITRIENRDLYKIAYRQPAHPDIAEETLEARLQDETGLDQGDVLVDFLQLDDTKTYDVPIIQDDTVSMEHVSPLPTALKDALNAHRELRIYAPRSELDAVAAAAERMLSG